MDRFAEAESTLAEARAKLAQIADGYASGRPQSQFTRQRFVCGAANSPKANDCCWRLRKSLREDGPHSPRYGMVLDHLCELHHSSGQTDEAEREIRAALQVYEGASHTESADYAFALAG